jgi:PhzF family phenazine biosynthesis protein
MVHEKPHEQEEDGDWLSQVQYRSATPTDMFQCVQLEKASYPAGEAGSKNALQYRQHHAAPYFRCAVIVGEEDDEEDEDVIVGYICSTRCEPSEDDTLSTTHQRQVPTLIIHSIVVREEYRRQGLGMAMLKNYIAAVQIRNATLEHPMSKLALFVRQHLLTFCIQCGFSSVRPTKGLPGKDPKYYLALSLQYTRSRTLSKRDKRTLAHTPGRECYVVDSFTENPGTGNPAAVVLLPEDTDLDSMAKWMQTVAAEFNLAETAFCWPRKQREDLPEEIHWNIRYFTPKVEVPMCGHATLASAAILYQTLPNSEGCRIVFHALENSLTVDLAEPETSDDDGQSLTTKIMMEFPSKAVQELKTREERSAVLKMLESAFSCDLEPLFVGISNTEDVLIELTPDSFQDIGYGEINYKALLEWDGYYRGVIVCCGCDDDSKGGEEKNKDSASPDFLSRFFAPKAGVNEDPVRVSAHRVLAPYFSQKLDKEKLIGKQMSERGGIVECWYTHERIRITGTAVTTMCGTLWL